MKTYPGYDFFAWIVVQGTDVWQWNFYFTTTPEKKPHKQMFLNLIYCFDNKPWVYSRRLSDFYWIISRDLNIRRFWKISPHFLTKSLKKPRPIFKVLGYLNCIYERCTCDRVKQCFLVVMVIGLWLLYYIIYIKCFLSEVTNVLRG